MSNCRIPAEESGWQWRWRLPPDVSSESDEDSSLTSSEDECTTRRRPPKKKLRWMGEKMPLKNLEKPLSQISVQSLMNAIEILDCFQQPIIEDLATSRRLVFTPSQTADERLCSNNRLLMFCFVEDMLMIPNDPLGLQGPCLEDFLSFPKQNSST